MKIEQFLGVSWRTTLWGWVTLLCAAISLKPELVAFLPDTVETYVTGIAGIIAFISGGVFAAKAKDSNVTGGTIINK